LVRQILKRRRQHKYRLLGDKTRLILNQSKGYPIVQNSFQDLFGSSYLLSASEKIEVARKESRFRSLDISQLKKYNHASDSNKFYFLALFDKMII
jgi:hypothetical protein